ncbi:MAG: c-type cytochrome [SAR202 cluster bacterium]|nr:c-type cytochrome [SAR202 cluster bacterium]
MFKNPGRFDYVCSAHPDGQLTYHVSPGPNPTVLLGAQLTLAGILVQVSGLIMGGFTGIRGIGALAGGAMVLLVGVLTFVEGAGVGESDYVVPAENPFPATAASIDQGKTSYLQFCSVCHGDGGLGDGPLASSLDPAPSDLNEHVPIHPDSYLFATVSNGLPGSGMPALGGAMTEEEIWRLINYLRDFAGKQ